MTHQNEKMKGKGKERKMDKKIRQRSTDKGTKIKENKK